MSEVSEVSMYIPIVTVFVILLGLIYKMVPFIICRSGPLLREIRDQFGDNRTIRKSSGTIDIINRIRRFFQGAGIRSRSKQLITVLFYLIPPSMLVVFQNKQALMFSLCWICFLNNTLSSLAKKRTQHFGSLLYKVYRFINMELDSGLQIGEILISLPESSNDRELRQVLDKMSAAWKLTGDLDLAIRELDQIFGKHETALLANNLRQCLISGVAGKSFVQMESLLFARYIEHVRRKSKQLQFSLLLCAVMALLPVIIIMLWPVIAEMLSSLSSIFY